MAMSKSIEFVAKILGTLRTVCEVCRVSTILHCIVCNVVLIIRCTEYIVQSAVYWVQWAECMYKVHCTLYIGQCTKYRVQCTEYARQSAVYRVQLTEYSGLSTKCVDRRLVPGWRLKGSPCSNLHYPDSV